MLGRPGWPAREAAGMADDSGQGGEWLSLTRAADRLGWSRERLRALVRRDLQRGERRKFETMRSNNGELLVRLTPELATLAAPGRPPWPATPGDHGRPSRPATLADQGVEGATADLVAELWARLALVEGERDRLAGEVERWREAHGKVEVEVARLTAEAEGERRLNTELRRQTAKLEAEVAELRQPWWAKVLAALRARSER
jgi:hypothetical protein